jgi:molybdopterin-synthase adenylyltransferase
MHSKAILRVVSTPQHLARFGARPKWGIINPMNSQERERYLRQTIFAPLGAAGQERLLAARVVIVGCGANGSAMANTLARAGVGTLVIVDRDYVELNNLPRQMLFDEEDVSRGAPKAIAAEEKLRRVNSSIKIESLVLDVNSENIEDLIANATLVMDGTDNFQTRLLLNDACVKNSIPWIYVGAVASYGMTMTIVPHKTACLRCVFQHEPAPGTLPTCDTAGVIGPIVGVMASIACAEAIKLLAGAGTLNPGIINVDLWDNSYDTLTIARRADCPTCGQHKYDYLEGSHGDTLTTFLCGHDAIQVNPGRGHSLDLAELADRLRQLGPISQNEYLLRFSVDKYELTIFPDGRMIAKGTDDAVIARGLYSKYVGS